MKKPQCLSEELLLVAMLCVFVAVGVAAMLVITDAQANNGMVTESVL